MASALFLGGGLGLFMSNTVEFTVNFTSVSAVLMAIPLAFSKTTRKWTESVALGLILLASVLATHDAIDDSARWEAGERPTKFGFYPADTPQEVYF